VSILKKIFKILKFLQLYKFLFIMSLGKGKKNISLILKIKMYSISLYNTFMNSILSL
jgi:hypothetical protein